MMDISPMTNPLPSFALLLLCPIPVLAQRASSTPPPASAQQSATAAPSTKLVVVDSVQVTTTVEPLPFAESDRSVEMLQPREMPVGTDSVVDLLRTDSSLNLQARGGEGVQADLAIRGTTFEQSLVLVNGL